MSHQYSYPIWGGAVAGCADVINAMVLGIETFVCALYIDPRFIDALQTVP